MRTAFILFFAFMSIVACAQDNRQALGSDRVKVSDVERLEIQLTAKDAEILKAQMAVLEERFKHLQTIIGGQIRAARSAHQVDEGWKYDIQAGQFQKAESESAAGKPPQRLPLASNK